MKAGKNLSHFASLLKDGLKEFSSILVSWAKNPFFWLLLIDTLLYNSHLLFQGRFSNAPMFQSPSAQGDLQYWVLDMSFLVRVTFTPLAVIICYLTNYQLTRKGFLQVIIYYLMAIKDVLDYLTNGEQGNWAEDLIILFGALFCVEILARVFGLKEKK